MVALVREMAQRNKIGGPPSVTAPGCWPLPRWWPGKNVTCFFAIKDDLVHAGATYTDAEVVVDGNLITSRQPADLPAFLGAIIAGLG